MQMNRRIAIRNLALVLGGAAILPSCIQGGQKKASIALKKIAVSKGQERLLEEITETLIPHTDTPGAKDLKLHLFILKMVDDCYSGPDQEAFLRGLDQLGAEARKRYGKALDKCTREQREALLAKLEPGPSGARQPQQQKAEKGKAPVSDDRSIFYRIAKQEAILGYTHSKYFMTKQIVYEMAPGRYNPRFPVKQFKERLKHG